MKKPEGKITIMTGAGYGCGMSSGFPAILAKEGSHLILNRFRQDPEGMKKSKENLEACGVRVVLVEGDISEEEMVKGLIGTTVAEFGRIDVLINCVGILNPKLLTRTTTQEWNRMLTVDLASNYSTRKYVIPVMIKQNFERIINLASQVRQKGGMGHCHYVVAKAGVIGFTKPFIREAGKHSITANCIAFGPIKIQLMGVASDEWRKGKEAELVLPRFGGLEEILPTAVFLAAEPDGNLYTGQTLGPNLGDVMY